MLPNTKGGFSLLEVIIAVAIIAGLSIVSVQSLWDSISTRSKQYSLETSASVMRQTLSTMTQAIISSNQVSIDVSSTSIKITGSPCRTIQLNSVAHTIDQAVSAVPSCTPPTSGFSAMTPSNVTINSFTLNPTGSGVTTVTLTIAGVYKDSLGSHSFQYDTTVSQRTTL